MPSGFLIAWIDSSQFTADLENVLEAYSRVPRHHYRDAASALAGLQHWFYAAIVLTPSVLPGDASEDPSLAQIIREESEARSAGQHDIMRIGIYVVRTIREKLSINQTAPIFVVHSMDDSAHPHYPNLAARFQDAGATAYRSLPQYGADRFLYDLERLARNPTVEGIRHGVARRPSGLQAALETLDYLETQTSVNERERAILAERIAQQLTIAEKILLDREVHYQINSAELRKEIREAWPRYRKIISSK